jgi:hypothetical protein
MINDSYCPQCGERLVEHLIERGVALACPICASIYHVAEFVADSPAFPHEVREGAGKLSDAAFGIGLLMLLAKVFD